MWWAHLLVQTPLLRYIRSCVRLFVILAMSLILHLAIIHGQLLKSPRCVAPMNILSGKLQLRIYLLFGVRCLAGFFAGRTNRNHCQVYSPAGLPCLFQAAVKTCMSLPKFLEIEELTAEVLAADLVCGWPALPSSLEPAGYSCTHGCVVTNLSFKNAHESRCNHLGLEILGFEQRSWRFWVCADGFLSMCIH